MMGRTGTIQPVMASIRVMKVNFFFAPLSRFSLTECANQISDYITRKFCYKLNREELLYLNMHITRLCSREECNRKGITSEE